MKNELINDAKILLEKIKEYNNQFEYKKEILKSQINSVEKEIERAKQCLKVLNDEWAELNSISFENYCLMEKLKEFKNR